MPPPVRIGELRDHVTVQAATTTKDKYGEDIEKWEDIESNPIVPAEVRYQGGRETVVGQQMKAVASWRVRIRHRRDVTTANRFLFEDKILTIADGGDPDGRNHELRFECIESVDLAVADEGE